MGNTRTRISAINERIEELNKLIAICREYNHDSTDMQMELYELEQELNFAWQDDEQECDYHNELINELIAEGCDPFEAQEYADKVCGWS